MNMPVPDKVRRRRRLQMMLLVAVFVLPALVALLLGAVGWRPGTNGYGQPVLPQRSVMKVDIALAGGGNWAWRAANRPRMTLVALPGPDCAEACLETLKWMRNARITLNDDMKRLRLLYVGPPPQAGVDGPIMRDYAMGRDVAGALAEFRATKPDSVAALLVESNGTALSWYPAGFDPNGLKDDLHKVFR